MRSIVFVVAVAMLGLGNEAFAQGQNSYLQNRVSELEAQVAALQAAIATIEANTVLQLDGRLSLDFDIENRPVALFEAVNVKVTNGTGFTDVGGGLGNLIIGYNEAPVGCSVTRDGSHDLVIGRGHNYTSVGGFVAGFQNTISGPFASVSGGLNRTAIGRFDWVAGELLQDQ